jgi:PAS domain S-box-containing protein
VSFDSSHAVELRLRTAVEWAPSGLVMTDGAGKIVLVNREIERLFGYSREELLGQPIERLVPTHLRSHHSDFSASFMAAPSMRAMGAGRELRGLRKDGTEVPVEVGLTPVTTDDGLFVLGTVVDITARKHAETERRDLEEQLRQAQKMEALGRVSGGLAHDFNNILGAILGFADLIGATLTEDDARSDLAELLKAVRRGKALADGVLAFSRRRGAARRPMALEPAVRDAVRLLGAALPASIEVELEVLSQPPSILGDAGSVQQVVSNLATNAALAMPNGGAVRIVIEPFYVGQTMARARPDLREGAYARLSVQDTGVGMDRTVRERAFEPFFTTRSQGVGSGLGLAVVYGIMKEHEGAVDLENEPGRGTTVRCLFPALTAGADTSGAGPQREPRRGARILLLDDEPLLTEIDERRLAAMGYKVTRETDGRRALELVRARPDQFDLVITDYVMPGMTGLEFARALTGIRADLPILMLTGFYDVSREALAAAGIRDVARKPLTKDELGQAVADALGGGSPIASSRLSPG